LSAYIDRDGQPQASLDITADRLILLDRNGDSSAPPDEDTSNIPF